WVPGPCRQRGPRPDRCRVRSPPSTQQAPAMNLAESLAHTAAAHPHRVAIRLGDDTLSYRDLDDASARVAGLLAARGVGPGDPVGIMLPNVPQFAVIYFGVLRAGGVLVPINPLLQAPEVGSYLGATSS